MVFSGLLPSIGGGSSPHFFGEFPVLLVPPGLLPSLPPPPSLPPLLLPPLLLSLPPPPPPLPLLLPPLLVSFPVPCLPVLIDEKMEPVASAVTVTEPVPAMACKMSEEKGTEVEIVWSSESSSSG